MNKNYWQLLLWLLLIVVAVTQLTTRTQWQTDLSSFLPHADGVKQEILRAELGQGPATRMWLIALSLEAPQQQAAQASELLAQNLRSGAAFRAVRNNSQFIDSSSQDLLFRYRYLLTKEPVDFSVAGLEYSFQDRLDDLSMPTAAFTEDLIASDPVNSFTDNLNQLEAQTGALEIKHMEGVWFNQAGSHALLFAESVANGMDAKGQALAWEELNMAVESVRAQFPLLQAQFAGAPFIALKTSQQTKDASIRLSLLAGGLLAVLILIVYRSLLALLMTALPVIIGILFAAAISSLVYPVLHVLTMAFGVTLIGLAIDYPVHILSHRYPGKSIRSSIAVVWPTLRLSVLTTLLAFSALIWTNFEGIARLGVFSVAGLFVAAMVSRYLLPVLDDLWVSGKGVVSTRQRRLSSNIPQPNLRLLPVLLVGAVIIVISGFTLARTLSWSDNLASLSPVPDALIKQEQQLRKQLRLPEPGTQIVVYADTLDAVLDKELLLQPVLEQARTDGLLASWQMAASVLLPVSKQLELQQLLPTQDLLQLNLQQAITQTPFVASAFEQFQLDVEASRKLPPLTQQMLDETALGDWLSGLLLDLKGTDSGGYAGIVRLAGLPEVKELTSRLDALQLESVWLVETGVELSQSLTDFRMKLTQLLLFSAGITILALLIMLRQPGRVLAICLIVSGSIIGAAWVAWLSGGSLNLLHLIGLILVAGFGIDYALFFTRQGDTKNERAATLQALLICLCSSFIVFALLAFSGIRILESIGIVVTSGVLFAFVFSWLVSTTIKPEIPEPAKEGSLC